jgi:secreted trypsin-like serine protease
VRRAVLAAVTVVLTALVALTGAGPASAITNGTADGSRHPNVGGLVSPEQYSDGTWLYCSGTLISPTVFLTAAHCATDGERVGVTFDPAYEDGDKVYYGTFQADPAYPGPSSDSHDIAVVVLDKPIKGIAPALLPEAGSLSGLSSTQTFTSVGYGAYEVTNSPGGHRYLYDDVRMAPAGR